MVLIDGVLYVLGTKPLKGTATPWGRMQVTKDTAGGLLAQGVEDPSNVLSGFKGYPSTLVGTVDDVTTYRFAVPIEDYVASKGKSHLVEQGRESFGDTIHMDVSIDAANLPVKIVEVPLRVTTTYAEWGTPVTIKAPPRAKVTDLGP